MSRTPWPLLIPVSIQRAALTFVTAALFGAGAACSNSSSDGGADAAAGDEDAPLRRCIQENDDSLCTCETESQRYFDAAFVPGAETYVNSCTGVCCYVPRDWDSHCVCSDDTGPCGPVAGNTVVGSCEL